jgi:hypothetical protein
LRQPQTKIDSLVPSWQGHDGIRTCLPNRRRSFWWNWIVLCTNAGVNVHLNPITLGTALLHLLHCTCKNLHHQAFPSDMDNADDAGLLIGECHWGAVRSHREQADPRLSRDQRIGLRGHSPQWGVSDIVSSTDADHVSTVHRSHGDHIADIQIRHSRNVSAIGSHRIDVISNVASHIPAVKRRQ